MNKKLIAVLLGTTMLVAPAASMAKNAVSSDPVVSASQSADKKANSDIAQLMKLSAEGNRTLQDVRAARIAIFNGSPDASKLFVDNALKDVKAARSSADAYKGRSTITADNDVWLPVDGSISIADDFVPSKAKMDHIAKANQHMKKGEKKQAVEELKLADVGVAYSRVMMPLQETQDHLQSAKQLLVDQKYYEANLALKAVEDSTVVDTVALSDAPKLANATNTGTKAKTAQNTASATTQKPAAKTAKQ